MSARPEDVIGAEIWDEATGKSILSALTAAGYEIVSPEEMAKLRTAASVSSDVHTLRTGTKLLADKVRAWGYNNRKQESNVQLVARVLDALRAKRGQVCPFDSDDHDLSPSDPCPVCGDLGEESSDCVKVTVSKCVSRARRA